MRKAGRIDLTCGVGRCYATRTLPSSMIGDVYAQTGDFFYRQVERHLFGPLGMTTASYGATRSKRAPAGRAHIAADPATGSRSGRRQLLPGAPAASVNASLRDMEQWLIAQMGGRPDVLPSNLLEVLHAPG